MVERELAAALGLAGLLGVMTVLLVEPAPTGNASLDVGWSILFGAAVPIFASRASRWTHLWAGILAAVGAGLSIWALFGLAAAIVGLIQQRRGRNPVIGAVAGVAVLQAAMHIAPLAADGPMSLWGVPSLITTAAVAPYAVSGFQNGSRKFRRYSRLGAALVGTILVIGIVGFGIAGLSARDRVNQGVDAARSGLNAARSGDQERANSLLDISVNEFNAAKDSVGGFLSQPAQLVPVVAQHRKTILDLSRQANEIARAAKTAIESADVEQLRPAGGKVDLELVAQLGEAVEDVNLQLVETDEELARVDRDWLVPPLLDAVDDLRSELATSLEDSLLAERALEVVPRLLGADGTRRYFVIFGQPAESRELGGFLGAYAVVTANDGEIELQSAAENGELVQRISDAQIEVETESLWFDGYDVANFPQNVSGSPDMASVGPVAKVIGEAVSGATIDGVLYIDPKAIGALIDLVETINPPVLGRSLTGSEAEDFLLRGQYAEFEDPTQRTLVLVSILEQTFGALTSATLPGPERLGEVLGPAARAGRLQLWTPDDDANNFLEQVFLLRPFLPNDGSDFLAVVQTNGAPSKLDAYLTRVVNYAVDYDPNTGRLSSVASVTLTSSASTSLPEYVINNLQDGRENGANRVLLSVMTPHQIGDVRVDGEDRARSIFTELGYNRALLQVDVPPGQSVIVDFEMEGSVWPGTYLLDVANQPLPNDDELTVSISAAEGWTLTNADALDSRGFTTTLDEDLSFRFESTRD